MIYYFEEVDSTNSLLKREYQKYSESDVIVSNHQTQGRGRLGRNWYDDSSSSLTFSILHKDNLDPNRISLLSLLTGIAIHLTLNEFNIPSKIKWPNDVLINDKKCCGILLEAITDKKIIALINGIGLNLNEEEFPDELKDKATSLYLYSKKKYDKKEVLKKFFDNYFSLYLKYQKKDDSYLEILASNNYLKDREVYLNYYNERKSALVKGIDSQGKLLVEIDNKIISLNAGEVTLEEVYKKV